MKSRHEIVAEIANGKVVETMVENIAHRSLSPNLKDLCQMVYLVLLTYAEDKILDLYEHGQMRFFIARVILNQYNSSNSPYYLTIRKFREHSAPLTDKVEGDKHPLAR